MENGTAVFRGMANDRSHADELAQRVGAPGIGWNRKFDDNFPQEIVVVFWSPSAVGYDGKDYYAANFAAVHDRAVEKFC